jgi:hypothetical protein
MSTAEMFSARVANESKSADQSQTRSASSSSEAPLATEALSMWLRWNAAYELVASKMFEKRQNLDELQRTLDLVDELRRSAVELTQKLLRK